MRSSERSMSVSSRWAAPASVTADSSGGVAGSGTSSLVTWSRRGSITKVHTRPAEEEQEQHPLQRQ